MRIRCRYSGVEYHLPGQFSNFTITATHPLIEAGCNDPSILINKYPEWASGSFSKEERRVYFVALLASTNLVEFRVAAEPLDTHIQLNTELLIKTLNWYSAIGVHLNLPSYTVTNETKSLANIRQWIDRFTDAKKDWDKRRGTNEAREAAIDKLAACEERLQRLTNSIQRNDTRYYNTLASWAFQASGAEVDFADETSGLLDRWRAIFHLNDVQVILADANEIKSLHDYMHANLELGSIYSIDVLSHLTRLLKVCEKGLLFNLFGEDEDAEENNDGETISKLDKWADFQRAEQQKFSITRNELTIQGSDNFTITPPVAPREDDFGGNKIKFLIARTKYLSNLDSYHQYTARRHLDTVHTIENEDPTDPIFLATTNEVRTYQMFKHQCVT